MYYALWFPWNYEIKDFKDVTFSVKLAIFFEICDFVNFNAFSFILEGFVNMFLYRLLFTAHYTWTHSQLGIGTCYLLPTCIADSCT